MRRRWSLVTGAVLVAFLSLIPGSELPEAPFTAFDLLVHFALYGTWSLFVIFESSTQYADPQSRFDVVWKLILIATYGGLIEVVQEMWIPGRYGDWIDFLANGAGTAASYFLVRILKFS